MIESSDAASAAAVPSASRKRLVLAVRVLALVAVLACVAFFARSLDWPQVRASFARANLGMALLATVVGLPCTALQGLRWASLVSAIHPVRKRTAVAAMYVGQAASVLLPLRAGEAVRTELMARATGLGRAVSLGTVAVDHLVNASAMFIIAAALPLLLPVPRWMAVVLWAGLAVVALVAVVVVRLAHAPPEVSSTGRLAKLLESVRAGLTALRHPRLVLRAAGFAFASWAVEIAVATLSLNAFGLPHDIPHAMAVLFGVNLALAIPSPPASLGNFELGAGMALVAFGGDKERAAAFALGYHALQLLPTLAMGGLMLPHFRKSRLGAAPSANAA